MDFDKACRYNFATFTDKLLGPYQNREELWAAIGGGCNSDGLNIHELLNYQAEWTVRTTLLGGDTREDFQPSSAILCGAHCQKPQEYKIIMQCENGIHLTI